MDRAEHRLLLACARACGDNDERRELILACLAGGLDWEYVLQAAAVHRLTSLLYWHLNLACPGAVPSPVLERLRQHFTRNTATGLLLTARLLRILGVFEAAGVPAIPYKGPVLAETLYENPGAREFDDLDILVEPRNVQRAAALLPQLGYDAPREYPARVQAQILRREHHVHVTRGDGSEPVEIHWNVVNEFLGPPLPVERWWSRACRGRAGGREVLALSPEDLLVALLVHGAVHLWSQLRWVADVARLVQRNPALDWDYLWNGHSHPDLRRMVSLGLLVARDLAAAAIPEIVLERARRDREAVLLAEDVARGLFQPAAESIIALAQRNIAFQVRLRTAWRRRLAYQLNIALTPTLLEWDVALPRWLFPLYFVLRPFRLVGKYASGAPKP